MHCILSLCSYIPDNITLIIGANLYCLHLTQTVAQLYNEYFFNIRIKKNSKRRNRTYGFPRFSVQRFHLRQVAAQR